MYHQVSDSRVGDVLEIRSPFQVNGQLDHDLKPNTIAPGLGEHTVAVLQNLGLSAADIEALKRDAVI